MPRVQIENTTKRPLYVCYRKVVDGGETSSDVTRRLCPPGMSTHNLEDADVDAIKVGRKKGALVTWFGPLGYLRVVGEDVLAPEPEDDTKAAKAAARKAAKAAKAAAEAKALEEAEAEAQAESEANRGNQGGLQA